MFLGAGGGCVTSPAFKAALGNPVTLVLRYFGSNVA